MRSIYKIGRTRDLAARLRSHGSSLADALEVVYVFKTRCVDKVESCMKLMLREMQYRKYKEVYEVDLDVLKKVIAGCDDACIQTVFSRPQRPATKGGGVAHGDDTAYFAVLVKAK
jgi:hypothetical protein